MTISSDKLYENKCEPEKVNLRNKSVKEDKSSSIDGKRNELPTLTLLTPIGRYLISDLKSHQVAYEHLLNLVTEYTQIPQKLLSLMVGRKRLKGGSYLDVRNQNIINVFVRGCGGAGDENVTICCICGSKISLRYYKLEGWDRTKIDPAQTLAKKTLCPENDQVCHKCERHVARKVADPDYQPKKKPRSSNKPCFLRKADMCTNDATISTQIFSIPQFCRFFGISHE